MQYEARGIVLDDLARRYGGIFREVITTPTIATLPIKVVTYNPERVALVVVNGGSQNKYLSPRENVSATNGITIPVLGGIWTINIIEDFILPSLEWWMIGTAVPQAPWILEIVREAVFKEEANKT